MLGAMYEAYGGEMWWNGKLWLEDGALLIPPPQHLSIPFTAGVYGFGRLLGFLGAWRWDFDVDGLVQGELP